MCGRLTCGRTDAIRRQSDADVRARKAYPRYHWKPEPRRRPGVLPAARRRGGYIGFAPILYIADTFNNRVLAWKNAAGFNNGDSANLVIGQRDKFSTLTGGPGTTLSHGLNAPVAVAVDRNGNLYVADSGNNRILRYPHPFSQTDTPIADLVIGQASISSGKLPNQGQSAPSASTLSLGPGNTAALAFDSSGNLWFTDSGNDRVLRYNASALSAGGSVSADLVLGQPDFVSATLPAGTDRVRWNKAALVSPSGIAISEANDVYVSDSYLRVLYYRAPAGSGAPANRVLGVVAPTKSDPRPVTANGCPNPAANPPATAPCETTLGANGNAPPQGLAVIGNQLFVADTPNNRIVKYDSPDKWVAECPVNAVVDCAAGTAFSTPIAFLGQPSGNQVKLNQGLREPNSATLASPVALATAGSDLWVDDASNNRILFIPSASGVATKVLGQNDFSMSGANLVENRGLFIFGGASGGFVAGGSSIAVDPVSNHMFVSDSLNNRVLGFADYRKVNCQPDKTCNKGADIVIGQRDFFHSTPNWQGQDATYPTELSLNSPEGVAVDANGDLWVADAGNGRVLRYPKPFNQSGSIQPNLVLGKTGFRVRSADQLDPSRSNMRAPYGLAFTLNGSLVVSDISFNRVLVFKKPDGGDFTSSANADLVIGQPDFVTVNPGNDATKFSSPRGIALDSSDRLYVADGSNNRLQVFSGIWGLQFPSPRAVFSQAISSPHSVAVNARPGGTGEIWVTDLNRNQVLRYPQFDLLALNPGVTISTIPSSAPFAATLDPFENPIVADGTNRVAFYYPRMTFTNSASYSTTAMTPGMIALLWRLGPSYEVDTTFASTLPLPTVLNDIQVTVNGTSGAALPRSKRPMDFQVPWKRRLPEQPNLSSRARPSGQVLAAADLPMNVASPALFTVNQQGFGQIAAVNQDGTINSPANPATIGSVSRCTAPAKAPSESSAGRGGARGARSARRKSRG